MKWRQIKTFIINTRCSNCFTFVFMYSVDHHKLNAYLYEVFCLHQNLRLYCNSWNAALFHMRTFRYVHQEVGRVLSLPLRECRDYCELARFTTLMFKWNWEIIWDEASIIIHVLLRYWHMAWNGRVQHHHAIALLHMVHVIHILHCMKYDVSMTYIVNCSGKTSIYFRQRKLMYVSG